MTWLDDAQTPYGYDTLGRLASVVYPDGNRADYSYANGRLVGVAVGGAVYPIHADQAGRPQAITNASSQAVVWASKNDAFDRNTTYNAWGAFNIGFPGQYWDVESTLWHNGFRDYDARTGRYVQSDSIGLVGGVNTYSYVEGNPLSRIDPFGLYTEVVYWHGVGVGKSQFGHISTNINGQNFSWGPPGQ